MSERIIYGDKQISNDTWVTGLNNNDLIVGPSGAGKTRGYVIPNILNSNESMLVTDTKGNLYDKLKLPLEKKGFKVYLLDFDRPERSCHYNIFDYIGKDSTGKRYREKDVHTIASALCPVTYSKDPFWEMNAQTIIASYLAYIIESREMSYLEEGDEIGALVDIYTNWKMRDYDKYFGEIREWYPGSYAAKLYNSYRNICPVDKTYSCIMRFVGNALSPFLCHEMKHIFYGKSDFRFEQLGKEKCVVFVNVSDCDRSMDKLISLFYTQALQTLISSADKNKDNRLSVPVRFILDDFATNCRIDNFDKLVSVIRSREISASIILQSETQLTDLYGMAKATTIINNFDHYIYLGGHDEKTIRSVAFRANVPVSRIQFMPLKEAVIFERGSKPSFVKMKEDYQAEVEEEPVSLTA